MKIRQISVFLENRPGRLSTLCHTLAEAGVNLSTLMLSEASEFGLLRIITPDVEKATEVLSRTGYAATASEVAAIQIPDKPGGLAAILTTLEPHNISVEYMYAYVCRHGRAIMLICFNDLDDAISILQKTGFKVISSADLFHP
jgi:hypothetical protein